MCGLVDPVYEREAGVFGRELVFGGGECVGSNGGG